MRLSDHLSLSDKLVRIPNTSLRVLGGMWRLDKSIVSYEERRVLISKGFIFRGLVPSRSPSCSCSVRETVDVGNYLPRCLFLLFSDNATQAQPRMLFAIVSSSAEIILQSCRSGLRYDKQRTTLHGPKTERSALAAHFGLSLSQRLAGAGVGSSTYMTLDITNPRTTDGGLEQKSF